MRTDKTEKTEKNGATAKPGTKTEELLKRMTPPWRMAGCGAEETVLLALSGGADSVALLHLLSAMAKRDGFSVVTAHVNHGIRGAEADGDADFCRRLSASYGWEHLEIRADVPALAARNKRSLELEAREVRYAFFAQIMEERDIPLLVTAHHGDDNLETVLFRLCRGTGLHGLCGIPPVREFAKGWLVRPLLPFSKGEILSLCEEEGLEYVTDSTNLVADCSRNRIRLELIPHLERQFAEPQRSVHRMTVSLTQDQDYLCAEAKRFLEAHSQSGGVAAEALRKAHPAVRRRVIGMLLPRALEAVHVEAVESLLESNVSGAWVSLPGDRCACLQNGVLAVLPVLPKPEDVSIPFAEGEFSLCDGMLTVSVKKIEKSQTNEIVHNTYTSSCIMIEGAFSKEGLCFRPRREGETLLRNGIHRRLRRLYREAGVPTVWREALPVLGDGEGVLWAPYVGFRDGAVTEASASREGQAYLVTVNVIHEK